MCGLDHQDQDEVGRERERWGERATATRRQAYIAESWREFVCTRLAGGQSLFGSEDELLRFAAVLCVWMITGTSTRPQTSALESSSSTYHSHTKPPLHHRKPQIPAASMRTPMQSCVQSTCLLKSFLAVVDALLTAISPISPRMMMIGTSGT